jgi:hypothetical protein
LGERVVECVAVPNRLDEAGGFCLFQDRFYLPFVYARYRHQAIDVELISQDARLFESLLGARP